MIENDLIAKHPDRRPTAFWATSTLTTQARRWSARHPNVHFHFIPTYSSWLNMVEVWFSIVSREALRNVSCTEIRPLRDAIDRFVAAYQPTATPFESGPKPSCILGRLEIVTLIYASKY